jgi:hypothetical protein
MNGDSRETGKLTPEGDPDPSVFSTQYKREGIRVGTAVCVMVRKPTREKKPIVRFRDFWGATKRADLLKSLNAGDINAEYATTAPEVNCGIFCARRTSRPAIWNGRRWSTCATFPRQTD